MRAEIVAHRGANREAPENTIAAFQRAIEIGVQGIELDVQLTGDGVPVVHHDPNLRGVDRPIASMSLDEVKASGDTPSLDEVLGAVNSQCRLYVEIKAPAAVEAVVDRLKTRRSWCAVHSFDHRVVARARSLDPELTTGILLVSYLIDVVSAMRAAGARDLWQQADYIDRELVDRVHDAGGRVFAWTVNDVARARELIDVGVDVICTDSSRELVSALSGS
jgi:glycerophosphoryl diester phosphodiesterase